MGFVFRKKSAKPLPDGAEVYTRKGEQLARWRDGGGKLRTAKVTGGADGVWRIVQEAGVYTARYRDGQGILREVPTGCRSQDGARAVLAELERQAELVRSGIVTPAEAGMASHVDRPLSVHIDAYAAHLRAKGCTPKHVRERKAAIELAAKECRFARLRDLNRSAAERWIASCALDRPLPQADGKPRAKRGIGARARNAYRTALVAFGNWLVESGRLAAHPFDGLPVANERADRRHQRRALSADELIRLIEAARTRPLRDALTVRTGKRAGALDCAVRPEVRARLEALGNERALAYKTLALTGLRYGELRSLRCSQAVLDDATPHLVLHAKDEKARRGARIALQEELARELGVHIARRTSRAVGHSNESNVIAFHAPEADPPLFDLPRTMCRIFALDLQAAGIPKRDAQGRVLDVHALRHTFGTMLARAGVPLQVAQRAMRHSTPILTASVYTHLDLGDMGAAVSALPMLGGTESAAKSAAVHAQETPPKTPLKTPLTPGKLGHGMSHADKSGAKDNAGVEVHNTRENRGDCQRVATAGRESQWSGREDSNLRSPAPKAGAPDSQPADTEALTTHAPAIATENATGSPPLMHETPPAPSTLSALADAAPDPVVHALAALFAGLSVEQRAALAKLLTPAAKAE